MEAINGDLTIGRGSWSVRVSRAVVDRILWALLAVYLVLMAYYICRGYRSDFHSDSAVKNLLAQEMLETGSYFPPDWNYVNGDLWILFGQAFVLPLLPWFKNGFLLHAFSGLISAALILYGVWLVMSLFVESSWLRRIALIVVAGGISALGAENLYGQVSYGSVLYVACFTLYLSWRYLEASPRAAIRWAIGLLALLVLAFWSNPQRAVAYELLPTFAALAMRVTSRLQATGHDAAEGVSVSRCITLGTLWIAGAAIGVVLHSLTLAHVTNIAGAASAYWLPFDLMVRNFWMSIQGLLAILGGLPTAGQKVMALEGLPDGVRMLAALMALILIPLAVLGAIRSAHPGRQFVGAYAAAGLALFFFLQVTTTTPDMSDPVTSARYMFPAMVFGLMVLISTLGVAEHSWQFKACSGVVVAVLAFGAFLPANPLSRPIFGSPPDGRAKMMAFLKAEGLEYGYATYWNAGANTVLSKGAVKVRQIMPKHGLVVPYRHLSSNRWYRPDAWTGPTFLILTDAEKGVLNWSRLTAYAGSPTRELRYGDFNIYVFPRNLAEKLPLWSNDVAFDLLSMDLVHTIGKDEVVDGHVVLASQQGEQGFLHFGPYLALEKGHYTLDIDLEVDVQGAGMIDVAGERGQLILASVPIDRMGRQRVSLGIDVPPGVTDLEVRVQSNGKSKMTMRSLTIKRGAEGVALGAPVNTGLPQSSIQTEKPNG